MTSGLPTFQTPWSRMPWNRCLARIAGLRGVRPVGTARCDVALTATIAPSHMRRLRRQRRPYADEGRTHNANT
jgi:hypothetical protein